MSSFGKGCHLHLIDGSAFIFRAYHALPPLTRKSDGLPIGAVSGFCNMLHRYVEDNHGPDAPTHVAVTAERAFMAAVGGSCQLPVAAYCVRDDEGLFLRGMLADADGSNARFGDLRGTWDLDDAERVGRELGQSLRTP